jgi:homoserine dehydrogenase
MEPYGVALIGCGTVGSGVAKLLLEEPERLAARAARRLVLHHVVVRDLNKPRPVDIPRNLLTTDVRKVMEDPEVDVAVEVVGGIDWARRTILDLLAAGKHVVTANKALLASHGEEIFNAGREYNRAISFEAAVAGGVPIVNALAQSLTANKITGILGILNGTSNFILTGMSEFGRSYEEALADAQREGYAEADPTLDVNGTDAAHKLAILSQIAFGVAVPLEKIPRIGITQVTPTDIRYADELGYRIKLLAEAYLQDNQLALHVSPVLLRKQLPLAQIRGTYNAIQVVGDAVGDTLYYGKGAGQLPTASAVVADIIDMAVGRAQRTFQTLKLWSGDRNGISLRPSASVQSRYCLRLLVEDRPGVLADVAYILARHKISISSVIQHEPLTENEAVVPLILMTHTAPTGVSLDAVAAMEKTSGVRPPAVYYPVAD